MNTIEITIWCTPVILVFFFKKKKEHANLKCLCLQISLVVVLFFFFFFLFYFRRAGSLLHLDTLCEMSPPFFKVRVFDTNSNQSDLKNKIKYQNTEWKKKTLKFENHRISLLLLFAFKWGKGSKEKDIASVWS